MTDKLEQVKNRDHTLLAAQRRIAELEEKLRIATAGSIYWADQAMKGKDE